jgi:hypothetical protein
LFHNHLQGLISFYRVNIQKASKWNGKADIPWEFSKYLLLTI